MSVTGSSIAYSGTRKFERLEYVTVNQRFVYIERIWMALCIVTCFVYINRVGHAHLDHMTC